MNLKEQIASDLKEAMKAGDTAKRDVLRMIDSSIKNVEIEKGKREKGLNDEEVIEVLSRAIKQRQDSITQYEKGGRPELADKEKAEMNMVAAYMPEQLSQDEVRDAVRGIIEKSGSVSDADFGKIMGQAMGQLKGKADGNIVKDIVKEELENK